MNQTEELATKRVFVVITLSITDYLFSCRFNSFLSSYRFILCYSYSFTGVDNCFLTGYKFIMDPWFIQMSPLLKAVLKFCTTNHQFKDVYSLINLIKKIIHVSISLLLPTFPSCSLSCVQIIAKQSQEQHRCYRKQMLDHVLP